VIKATKGKAAMESVEELMKRMNLTAAEAKGIKVGERFHPGSRGGYCRRWVRFSRKGQ
jgi:hypothetical protein